MIVSDRLDPDQGTGLMAPPAGVAGWAEVRLRLPLLAQERWYTHARRGYARGWEPVQFVDRIQRFLRLLEWQPAESAQTAASAPAAPHAAVPATAAPSTAPPPAPGSYAAGS